MLLGTAYNHPTTGYKQSRALSSGTHESTLLNSGSQLPPKISTAFKPQSPVIHPHKITLNAKKLNVGIFRPPIMDPACTYHEDATKSLHNTHLSLTVIRGVTWKSVLSRLTISWPSTLPGEVVISKRCPQCTWLVFTGLSELTAAAYNNIPVTYLVCHTLIMMNSLENVIVDLHPVRLDN